MKKNQYNYNYLFDAKCMKIDFSDIKMNMGIIVIV